jgi:hypothetical protein
MSHYHTKKYKEEQQYIETNRNLMEEIGIVPQGRFAMTVEEIEKEDWFNRPAKRFELQKNKNDLNNDFFDFIFYLGGFVGLYILALFLIFYKG